MKKATAIILLVLIFMSVVYTAFAANTSNKIYADAVTAESGKTVTVPIKIQSNEGFMGFAVIVTYDENVFTPVSVSKGSMLTGMFNDSIATSTDNSFKVVFTGTGDITSDGELFKIVFDVSDDISGTYDIELSYSQQDTFKEGWSDVVFNCEDAEIIVSVNGTTATETTTAPSNEPTTNEEETTTQPVTEPADEPDTEKPLSVRMKEWMNGLPFPLNIILGIFVNPIAFIISVFE